MKNDSIIKKLPPAVISTIAAGEVADRPVAVVKELIENSLDAAASNIEIVIEKAGLSRIQVFDNGHGMTADDLKMCAIKHTTSKISTTADLEKVSSLGFRGEALASIASMGQLTIQSRTLDSKVGHNLRVENEQISEIKQVGMPRGTIVIVENLYDQVPARKKFLKSPSTEFRSIVELVTKLALSNPEVGFSLIHNNKSSIQVASGQNLSERIVDLFGPDLLTHLVPLSAQRDFFRLEGVLGSLQVSRKNKTRQFLYVNGRSVTHAGISQAIKKSYGNLLEDQSEPFFVLHLGLPTSLYDSNVHPKKTRLAFMDEAKIISLVESIVKETVASNSFDFKYSQSNSSSLLTLKDSSKALPSLLTDLKKSHLPWSVKSVSKDQGILQINNTYLVVPKKDGFVVIDQHAAHERILYEQYSQVFDQEKGQLPPYKLSNPQALTLSAQEAELLTEYEQQLKQIGFEFETFGGNTFKVTQIPSYLRDNNPEKIIRQLLDDLQSGETELETGNLTKQTLTYLACRSAIMAGDPLTQDERSNLVAKLAKTKNRATCPHGRPTSIEFSLSELEKMFKRK